MNRKIFRTIPLVALAAVLLILAGCAGGTSVSKQDRINTFTSDINESNYAGLTGNVHPDAETFNQLDSDYWENYFPAGEDYTLDVSISGDTASGTIASSNGTEYPSGTDITIDFKNDPEEGGLFGGDSENWKIIRLVIGNTTIVQ